MPQSKLLDFLIDPSTGEGFNLTEDGSKKKYQLQRFLKLFGIELDNVKGLADNYKNLIDVDNIDSDLLPYLGELLGLVVNRDLPAAGRRREVKNIVHVYKNKGTTGGIERLLEGITGFEAAVDAYVNNILLSNKSDSISVDFTPSVIAKIGLPGDTTDYIVDFREKGIYGWGKLALALFITLDGEKKVTAAITKKISRVLPNFIPLNADVRITLIDAIYTEDFDIVETVSEVIEKINEKISEENYFDYTMITNNLAHLTNSKSSLTPFGWGDEWEDSISNL